MTKKRTDELARRSVEELKKLERLGVNEAKRISLRLRGKITQSFIQKKNFDIVAFITEKFIETLRDGMTAAHLQGARRAFLTKEDDKTLRLSAFSKLVKTLNRLTPPTIDADDVTAVYQHESLRILNDVSGSMEVVLRETVNDLIFSGANARQGRMKLTEVFEKLGLTKNTYRLEAIFRTQTQIAYSAGRWQADQDPAVQEILWGYEYSTVGDDRVRPEHEAMDGVKLPKEDPFWEVWFPPNGWNCRCQAIPIFQEEKIKQPPIVDDLSEGLRERLGNRPLEPTKGFAMNPGAIFSTAS